jgi:hypothetical protein
MMKSCATDFSRLLEKSAQFSTSNFILLSGAAADTNVPVFSNVHSNSTNHWISGHVEKSYEFSKSDLNSDSIQFSKSNGFWTSVQFSVSNLVSGSQSVIDTKLAHRSNSYLDSLKLPVSHSFEESSHFSTSNENGKSVELSQSSSLTSSRLIKSVWLSLSDERSRSFELIYSNTVTSSTRITISIGLSHSNASSQSSNQLESMFLVGSVLPNNSNRLSHSVLFIRSIVCNKSAVQPMSRRLTLSGRATDSPCVTFSEFLSASIRLILSSRLPKSSGYSLSNRFDESVSAPGSRFFRQSGLASESTGPPISSRLEALRESLERSFIWSKSNPHSSSLILLVSWILENSHSALASGSQSSSVPYSQSVRLSQSGVLTTSALLAASSNQPSPCFTDSSMNSISFLLSKSHHLGLSNDVTKSNSACSNFAPTVAVDKSKPESASDSFTSSGKVKQSAGLSDSISFVSHSIALSWALRHSFAARFNTSQSVSISQDLAISHIVGSGQFSAAQPFADGSAQGAGGATWPIVGSLLLLALLLACVVLFLLWRRKSKGSDAAEIPDDSEVELESTLGDGSDSDYEHDYWNPLDCDLSMTDEEGDLTDSLDVETDESFHSEYAADEEVSFGSGSAEFEE